MTQTTVPPVRVRARALVFVVAGIAVLSFAYACAETKRAPGEECLKSEDCLSGICSQLVCGYPGPLTDAMENNSEAGESDSGPTSEAAADTGAPDTFSAPETGGSEAGEASSGD
ncbi:MAG TPA: hypothetical protein VGL81_21830 [Polyangiaceae bacterium]|jgi:hypothetical protein